MNTCFPEPSSGLALVCPFILNPTTILHFGVYEFSIGICRKFKCPYYRGIRQERFDCNIIVLIIIRFGAFNFTFTLP
jgi:hypothetical protein